uniref:Uncharacterized protein n=1 Tax=Rhizophora mucronata TaxID=61149 RepID=A0A2P2LW16_RHIMU
MRYTSFGNGRGMTAILLGWQLLVYYHNYGNRLVEY